MRLHSEFHPLRKSAGWIADVLNDEDINDGAFSRVGLGSHHVALKATLCPATNLLFTQLLRTRSRGQTIPEALPVVFKHHGDVVRDDQGLVYTVWAVERLFHASDEREMRRARATSRHLFQGAKPGYSTKLSRLRPEETAALRAALAQEQASCASPSTWQGSAEIALTMSLRTSGELQKTFRFLLDFVERHQVALDLLTQGNILLNMFGEPCLSDPVCRDDSGEASPAPAEGTCVACLVPSGLFGIGELVLEPVSTLPLEEQECQELEQALIQLGLKPERHSWGSAQHKTFLAQPPHRRSLWSVPDAAKHLRQESYRQLFAG